MPATLKQGSKGKDVSDLQQMLVEAGFGIDATELASVTFGATTTAAVIQFQQAHGLGSDGIVGPKTWSVLMDGDGAQQGPPGWKMGPLHPDVAPAMDQSLALVGTVEDPPGSNRGPVIDALNKNAGIPIGSPWCAAFATGMYAYSPKNPFSKGIGSAYKIAEWGKKQKCVVEAKGTAMGGDILVILRGDGHGHVGLVACDLGDRVATIEGNSGNAVKQLIRKKADLTSFVRPLGLSLKV